MKTIDNTINYYELLMYYDDTSKNNVYELPKPSSMEDRGREIDTKLKIS